MFLKKLYHVMRRQFYTWRQSVWLQVLHVLDGHLDYFRLLDSTSTFFHVSCRYEPWQISQAVIHSVASPLFYYPVWHGILKNTRTSIIIAHRSLCCFLLRYHISATSFCLLGTVQDMCIACLTIYKCNLFNICKIHVGIYGQERNCGGNKISSHSEFSPSARDLNKTAIWINYDHVFNIRTGALTSSIVTTPRDEQMTWSVVITLSRRYSFVTVE